MTFHRLLIGSSMTAISLSVPAAQAEIVDVQDGGFSFTLGGQINRAFLFTDDGVESNEFFVDNDNSSTRLTARAAYSFGNYVVGALVEYEFEFSSSNSVSQLNSDISSSVSNERKFELFANTPYGNFAYGQGDAASNGTSEIDLSGTSLGNYSDVGLIAGGQIFRTAAGGFSGNTVGNFFSNFDGISRVERFRYDTPTFGGGLVASVSFGEDSNNDIAIRYTRTFGDVRVRGGIAYAQIDEVDRVAGSVSAFHDPTGLNVTFASGTDDLDTAGREDPGFNYVKLGYQKQDLLPWGSTSFAVDFYDGSDQAVNGSDSESYSIFAVQKIDRLNTEVYGGFRTFSAETPTESFRDIDAVFIGARYRF
ncbi:porin [Synechococcus sp. MU1644]|nr:porin [Synechococcus sp. MU1644]